MCSIEAIELYFHVLDLTSSASLRIRFFFIDVDLPRDLVKIINVFSKDTKMKDTTEILHLMEEGTKCQDHDMNRAKEAFRRAQVSCITHIYLFLNKVFPKPRE